MIFHLQEIYESVLITEMNQKVVDYLNQHSDDLPFDYIFGDKMRVAFPIGTDITAQSIMDDLKRIQHFDKVDLKKGEVIRKIKLDPKYGQGEHKEQKINIGKAIAALKVSENKKKKYLDWFAMYKDNLEAAFEKPEFIVILSRAPIDVVRMSDHRNIKSCHSEGGGYFQCAIQEAISGGAVAYVVLEEDFNELTEEDFQKREIFVDSDRGISGAYGLRPISRLRVRRLVDDNGDEIAIPDTKIYGDTTIPNFYKSLVNYLKNKQSITPEDFRDNSYTKKGGTYYDDDIRDLVANYFSDEENQQYSSDFKSIRHDWDDESGERRHSQIGLEDELKDIQERFNNRMEYTEASYNIYDDDEIMFNAGGYTKIDISKFNLPDDVDLMIEDEYGIRDAKNGENDDDYQYSVLVEYLHDKADIRIYRIEMNNQQIEISFSEEDYYSDSDKFDNYCYYLKKFDDQIEDMLDDEDELLEIFMEAGFIKEAPDGDPNYSMITEYLADEEERFENFALKGNKPLKAFNVDAPAKLLLWATNTGVDYPTTNLRNLTDITKKIITNLGVENFKPKAVDDPAQLQFDKFFESYTNSMEGIDFLMMGVTTVYNYNNVLVTDNFKINFKNMDNKNFQFVQFLDEFFPHILNALRLYCIMQIEKDEKYENSILDTSSIDKSNFEVLSKKHDYQNLKRVYSKYLK